MRDEVWFKHDARSRMDPKMAFFIKCEGMLGYGVFWGILEVLHYQNDHEFDLNIELAGIADQLKLEEITLQKIVDRLVQCGLLEQEGSVISQARLKRDQAKRSEEASRFKLSMQELGRRGGKASAEKRKSAILETNQIVNSTGSTEAEPDGQPKRSLDKREEREEISIREDTNVSSLQPQSQEVEKIHIAPKIAITEAEAKTLVEEFGREACAYYKNICSDWLVANGKTKKSPAAFMRNWIRKEIAERKGFYYPKSGENGYKPHTAANTAEKNFKYLESQYGTQGVTDMFNAVINREEKSSTITIDRGGVVPLAKKSE